MASFSRFLQIGEATRHLMPLAVMLFVPSRTTLWRQLILALARYRRVLSSMSKSQILISLKFSKFLVKKKVFIVSIASSSKSKAPTS
jgi:hypothetical protein